MKCWWVRLLVRSPRTWLLLPLMSVVLTSCTDSSGEPGDDHTKRSSASAASPISIDGVKLVSVWPTVRTACELAATKTQLRIACPTLAPEVHDPQEKWGLCRGMNHALEGPGCSKRSFIVEEWFHGPPTFRGVPGPNGPSILGHLAIFAISGKVAISGHTLVSCPAPKPLDTVMVDGVTGHLYSCETGFAALNSGHILLTWQKESATYGVGSHGHTKTSRKLIIAIAKQLDYVSSSDSG